MSKVEKKSIKKNSKEVAIKVENVSKTFRIPHEKISSVKGAVLGAFKSNSYEEFKALDDVSFEVKKGEFFGIIGRNGSGKSTLLKVLAGIYQADKGEVEVDGMISPFLELGIGFNLELSGRDNVYLNATVLGMTKKQIDEKFDSIVKFSELERFIDQKLKNYSSGMSVRLAFSVSIHANRDVLLMDEVLAVGDSNFQQKCFDEFKRLKNEGKTIILVSHSQVSVEDYCDRAIMLKNGKIVKTGSPKNIFEYYNTSFDDDTIFSVKKGWNGKRKDAFMTESYNRWGNFRIRIQSVNFNRKNKVYNKEDNISGNIALQINDENVRGNLGNVKISLGMYGNKDALIFLDSFYLKSTKDSVIYVPFAFDVPDLTSGVYRFSIRIEDDKLEKNRIIYDHWDKDNQIYIKNEFAKNIGLIGMKSIFKKKVEIVGMIRMRNEALVLNDTLDSFSEIVDGIIVFDDASTDNSVDIARNHPAVLEVIENKVWKKNRISEETENRQSLLEHAQRYNPEWLFYSDCDERFEGNIREYLLSKDSGNVDGIKISLLDAYMTKDDMEPYENGMKLFNFRKYYGPERRDILMIWRNKPDICFEGMDKREPTVGGNIITKFYCQHYGKSLSESHWEETCDYYVKNFPEPYHSKWKNRKGNSIHSVSDFNAELYLWKDAKNNSVKID